MWTYGTVVPAEYGGINEIPYVVSKWREITTTIDDENCTLMGYYTACSGNCLTKFQDKLSVQKGEESKKY